MESVLVSLLLFSPLVGFIINIALGKKLPKAVSGGIASIMVGISFVASLLLFNQIYCSEQAIEFGLFDWIKLKEFTIELGFRLDQLTLLWMLFVSGIGALIHIYSMGYMKDDKNYSRFFAYLNLFIFFMTVLVSGSNLLVMFIGWEGVGLCSYLLIGFWNENQNYNDAAKKAFIMNRIGDLGFLIGIVILAFTFNTIDFEALRTQTVSYILGDSRLTIATLALFVGAMGKSAQIPLYTWLPDAMAGPTPVSALIHAATMVTAGIFMLTRLNFLFLLTPGVMTFIAIIGIATALFAAIIALKQTDIKKVLAYSTVSQLGLMFMAVGLGAFNVAVFHVITHAFFKACLFLGAGSVIHGIGGEQDMRLMGGISRKMKITRMTMIISGLSIAGFFPFAGFFSKDEIMIAAFHNNIIFWVLGMIVSLLTAFYIARLVFLTFSNDYRGTKESESKIHESSAVMTFPLIVLAILAAVGGIISLPFGYSWLDSYLQPVLPQLAHAEHAFSVTSLVLMAFSFLIAIVGISLAYQKFVMKQEVPVEDDKYTGLNKVIYNKFYIDEIYNAVFVKPTYVIGAILKDGVDYIVRQVVYIGATIVRCLSKPASKLQNGNLGRYMFFFVLGFCAIVLFIFNIEL